MTATAHDRGNPIYWDGRNWRYSDTGAIIDHKRPCVHCGAPAVDCGGRAMHFTVSASGGKAAWLECFELVRGRRKYTGTEARVAS